MQLARILYKGKIIWAKRQNGRLYPAKGKIGAFKFSSSAIDEKKAKLLWPAQPSKIVLVGLNYRKHAKELGMKIPSSPIIFLKPTTSLLPPQGKIHYPDAVKRLDYEAELALVVKKKAYKVPTSRAKDYILGYCCLNDITARDIQKKEGQWTRAKSFDTFCPLGPWLETKLDVNDVEIKLYQNGILRQKANTSDFIFSPFYLLSFISYTMTLLPGDVISTGTPAGIGRLRRGDKVEVEIEGIGRLVNYVSQR